MKRKQSKRRVEWSSLVLCCILALVLTTHASEDKYGGQALPVSKGINIPRNLTAEKVPAVVEQEVRDYSHDGSLKNPSNPHSANESLSYNAEYLETIASENVPNVSVPDKFLLSKPSEKFTGKSPQSSPLNPRHPRGSRRNSKRTRRAVPALTSTQGRQLTSDLIALLVAVAEGLRGCALLVVHDEGGSAVLREFLWQDRGNYLPKSLFNLKDIITENSSANDTLLLRPATILLLNSLRQATCTHYLLMVQDKDSVLRVLQDLYQARALDLNAKFIIHTKLYETDEIGKFLRSQPLDRIVDALVITQVPNGNKGPKLLLSTHAFFSGGNRVALYPLGTWGTDGLHRVMRKDIYGQLPTELLTSANKDAISQFFPEKMKDFEGFQFRVSTFHYPPVVMLDKSPPEPGREPQHDGLEVRIMYTIAEALNIRAEIHTPRDGELWGSRLDNGSWTGAMGEVKRGDVDVSFANYFITRDRLEIVDMTSLHSIDYACFITPIPDPPPQYSVVWRPFKALVWLGLIISLIVMPPALLLTAAHETGPRLWFTNLGNSTMYVFGAMMTQSQSQELLPRTNPLRVSFAGFSMASFIVTVAYRSALFSLLLVPPAPVPVNTLQQLLHSGLQWGVRDRGGWESWFSDSKDPTARKIYEGFQFVNGIDGGIQRVLEGNFAFMNSGRFLRYLVASKFTDKYGNPKLHIAKECFVPFRIGFATPLFSVYTRRFNDVIHRIVEAGLVIKWFDDLVAKAAQLQRIQAREELASLGASPGDQSGQAVVLGLYHLQGVFIILALGFGGSFLVFVAELVAGLSRTRNRKSSQVTTPLPHPN